MVLVFLPCSQNQNPEAIQFDTISSRYSVVQLVHLGGEEDNFPLEVIINAGTVNEPHNGAIAIFLDCSLCFHL